MILQSRRWRSWGLLDEVFFVCFAVEFKQKSKNWWDFHTRTTNPNILGRDSFTHGSTHATNDGARLGTWHAGWYWNSSGDFRNAVTSAKRSNCENTQSVLAIFCNQHVCRFVLSNMQSQVQWTVDFHFHHHDMATSRNGLRWELQHKYDQMGLCFLIFHALFIRSIDRNMTFGSNRSNGWKFKRSDSTIYDKQIDTIR